MPVLYGGSLFYINEKTKIENKPINYQTIKYLIEYKNVNPREFHSYLFRLSCAYQNIDSIKYLLRDDRVRPSALNNESIKVMLIFKNKEIVKLLLTNQKVVDKLTVYEKVLIKNLSIVY
jgi:hypothetical protein